MVIYLDGASLKSMADHAHQVSGFTTNPSLMKKAGIKDYTSFADKVLKIADGKPVSFEVISDDLEEMENQARFLSNLAVNVYVKIPVTNTKGESTGHLISRLSRSGIRVNVTALMTMDQIKYSARYLYAGTPAILSVFAGRIADTGKDPAVMISEALRVKHSLTKVLWASTREVFNIKQAELAGCDIITVSPEILEKMKLFGKDLTQYSLETVKSFYEDSRGVTL